MSWDKPVPAQPPKPAPQAIGIRASTPEETIMACLDLEASQDPHVARAGRLLKTIGPAIQDWHADELRRGEKRSDLTLTLVNILGLVLSSEIMGQYERRHWLTVADELKASLDRHVVASIKANLSMALPK